MPKSLQNPAVLRIVKVMVVLLLALLAVRAPASGQGETTAAIVGSVYDPAGAPIAGAQVTLISADNGFKRSVKTDDAGRFSFPQLKPGPYLVRVEAEQFETQENKAVMAGLGQKQTVDFTLKIATSNQSVTVTDQSQLINPDNPNTATTLNARSLEDLPNPGGDMTYPLQFAAGALINTAGSGNDFRGRHERVWECAVQWFARSLERLHRGRAGNERPADQSEQRTLNEPGSWLEFNRRRDGQYAVLRGRSGPLRSLAGQLRDQIRYESLSREPVRALEWIAIQRSEFLHQRNAGQSQAALHGEPFRRQFGRPDPAR